MNVRPPRARALLDHVRFSADLVHAVLRTAGRRALRGGAHPSWSLPYELSMAALRVTFDQHHDLARGLGRVQAAPLPRALADKLRVHTETLAGVRAEIHVPSGFSERDPTILYLHGGGFVTCSPATHRGTAAHLAAATGARCVVPDYRLAPEFPFPAALDDAACVYRALRAAQPAQTLLVAGDSAGGGLCVSLMLKLRDEGAALPRAAALISPWLDLSLADERASPVPARDYLTRERLAENAALYAGAHSLTDPLISPAHADLRGLPPMLIQTGEWELLCGQILRFAERARRAGVAVSCAPEPAMLHAYTCFSGVASQGGRAIAAIGQYVRDLAD